MVVYARRIMGVETEYGITATGGPGMRPLFPDEVARRLFAPVMQRYSSTNVFTPNSSRLYLDVGNHPEIATGECDSLTQLLSYERAGDAIVNELAEQLEAQLIAENAAERVYLFKNNVDSAGNSYGCHENYLIGRDLVLKNLGQELLPFLVSRQLICGAGMVAPAKGVSPAQYLLSQRADQVWEGVSSATTRSRPIINTRDEPHGDSHRFRRMHVIVGDSNMAETSFALKVGSMLLMLEMLEAGWSLPGFELEDPMSAIRAIARDLSGTAALPLVGGGTTTALEIQRSLADAAAGWVEQRPDEGTPTAEMRRVVQLWQGVLESIADGSLSVASRTVDWAIKLRLLEQFRDKLGCGWEHPKLAQVDLAYHDIRPGRGLYDVLLRRGAVERWADDAAFAAAVDTPPPTTRAALRGRFLQAVYAADANFSVDWTRFKVNRPEPRFVDCLDPFANEDAAVDALIEYVSSQ